jgi:SAM-dependent methyltransferase
MATCGDVFEHIYQHNFWVHADGSGTGSTLEYTTETIEALLKVIKRYEIRSILDAGCGSCVWTNALLQRVYSEIPGFERYVGYDVSNIAVQRARERLAHLPNVHVEVKDLTIDPIPQGFDMIVSRDCLQHLSFADAKRVLVNVANAAPKLFLVGSYLPGDNREITTGDCYDVNLAKQPFEMWPTEILSEHVPTNHPRKHLFLYTNIHHTVHTCPFIRGA